MTMTDAVARIFETYTEEELLNAKDEPDTEIATHVDAIANVFSIYGSGKAPSSATKSRIKEAFHKVGHGSSATAAIANARRIFNRDQAA